MSHESRQRDRIKRLREISANSMINLIYYTRSSPPVMRSHVTGFKEIQRRGSVLDEMQSASCSAHIFMRSTLLRSSAARVAAWSSTDGWRNTLIVVCTRTLRPDWFFSVETPCIRIISDLSLDSVKSTLAIISSLNYFSRLNSFRHPSYSSLLIITIQRWRTRCWVESEITSAFIFQIYIKPRDSTIVIHSLRWESSREQRRILTML